MFGFGKGAEKTPEALEKLIRKGKMGQIGGFFAGMPEAERRTFATGIVALVPGFNEFGWLSDNSYGAKTEDLVREAATLAALASASFTELKKLGWQCMPPMWDAKEQELHLAILRDRAPDWIDRWAEWLLEENHRHWGFVRRMVGEGLCKPPETDFYVLGVIEGLVPFGDKSGLADAILAEGDLLDGLLWRLFEVEGGGELSLAACDKYTAKGKDWATALGELAARGEIDRGRLLDASLDALGRDFAQFRAGWFSRFHEFLEPTPEERETRADRYLDLLASPIPPTVSFAMKALGVLHKAKKLDGAAFVAHVEPVLYAKAKGTVKQALRLMTAFAKADGQLGAQACLTATAALEHPDSEVQDAALALLESLGDPADNDLRAAIEERRDVVAAPLRARLSAWLGAEMPANDTLPAADAAELMERAKLLPPDLAETAGVDLALAELDALSGVAPAMPYDGLNAPRLSEDVRLAPIETLDDLIALFFEALGKPEKPESEERLLDGLTRLCDQRPDDFSERTALLAKKVGKLLERLASDPARVRYPHRHLTILALAWLNGDAIEVEEGPGGDLSLRDTRTGRAEKYEAASEGIDSAFLLRIADASRLIANGTAAGLFSIPTHHGGWIAPAVLVSRSRAAQAAGVETGTPDRVLALLRLAPDGRAEALRAAGDIAGEWGAALRHALGGEETVGDSAALWVAAARARAPFADDEAVSARFPGLGPGAGEVGQVGHSIRVARSKSYTFHYFDLHSEPSPPATPPSFPGGALALMPTVVAHRTVSFRWWTEGKTTKRAEPLTPDYGLSPWGRTLQPANPDVLFASTASDTAMHSDDPRGSSASPYDGYTVAMDPDTPLTRMGLDMLCVGLNARDAAEGQLATDLLIAAIEDGRVTGPALGIAMAGLLYSGFVKPKRWAARLSDAARVSPLHMQTMRLALEQALANDGRAIPRDSHALMELLHELCVETGEAIAKPETRDFLGGIKGGGKAAKLAKTLLALTETDPLPHRRAAAAIALAGRIERTERWAGRREAAN